MALVNNPTRKRKQANDIADLPILLRFVKTEQESFIEVVAQVLLDNQFLAIPKTDLSDDLIDLKQLLKSNDDINRLINEDKK
jgi:hypothetical protein